jgi:hypothetical protein
MQSKCDAEPLSLAAEKEFRKRAFEIHAELAALCGGSISDTPPSDVIGQIREFIGRASDVSDSAWLLVRVNLGNILHACAGRKSRGLSGWRMSFRERKRNEWKRNRKEGRSVGKCCEWCSGDSRKEKAMMYCHFFLSVESTISETNQEKHPWLWISTQSH